MPLEPELIAMIGPPVPEVAEAADPLPPLAAVTDVPGTLALPLVAGAPLPGPVPPAAAECPLAPVEAFAGEFPPAVEEALAWVADVVVDDDATGAVEACWDALDEWRRAAPPRPPRCVPSRKPIPISRTTRRLPPMKSLMRAQRREAGE